MTEGRGPEDRERLGRDPGSGTPGSGDHGGMDRDSDRGYTTRDTAGRDFERDSGGGVREDNPKRGRGWGIAALILSILALLGSLFGVLNVILALPGVILGIVAMVKGSRGLGIAAIILSILAIVIGIVLTILVGAAMVNSPEFQQILQEAEQQSQ